MREILFRAKRRDNGEWMVGFPIRLYDYGGDSWEMVPFNTNLDTNHFVIPETIGQYTGIKDKNGRKIFEGDIINIEYDTTTVENCVVTYVGACFYGNTDFDSWELDYYVDIEVIGTVLDNADLLEG